MFPPPARRKPVSIICLQRPGCPAALSRPLDRGAPRRGHRRVPADRQRRRFVRNRRGGPQPRGLTGEPRPPRVRAPGRIPALPEAHWRRLPAFLRTTRASASSVQSASRPAGSIAGRIRDRVLLLGEPVREPTEVDSLDEVLFMIPRSLAQREPLSEAAELAWHAYAVEYGRAPDRSGWALRCRHPSHAHSLTRDTRLDAPRAPCLEIPRRLASACPGRHHCATCGAGSKLGFLRRRFRRLRDSAAAHAARRAARGGPCVLSDIRFDIDDVLQRDPNSPLMVVNLDRESRFADERSRSLELARRGRSIILTSRTMPGMIDAIESRPPDTSMLLTNLGIADLRSLAPHLPRERRLLGLRRETGCWILLGAAAEAAPQQWRSPEATPLGMRRRRRSPCAQPGSSRARIRNCGARNSRKRVASRARNTGESGSSRRRVQCSGCTASTLSPAPSIISIASRSANHRRWVLSKIPPRPPSARFP